MGLFGLFGGGNKKPLEEYLNERDSEFLRKCVEQDIIAQSAFPFENDAERGYFWGFVYPKFMWEYHMSLNDDTRYEAIPKKYERWLDFRQILKIAADKGDGRAAFYVAMFYELGLMNSTLYVENLLGASSEKDATAGSLARMADQENAMLYHTKAAEKHCGFETAYCFLKEYIADKLAAKGAEEMHILVDMMTVPHLPVIEDGIKKATGKSYGQFKLFGRFLCGILAGFRAPLPLATMAIQKDQYVASGITKGPDIFSGANTNIDASRKQKVKSLALGYVNKLAGEGNTEAIFAKNMYRIE